MHAEEFDFSEDDPEEDLHEEHRFSFAEELADSPSPKALDDVETPEPPMPNTGFPTISLVGDDDPAPVPVEPLQLHEPEGQGAGESASSSVRADPPSVPLGGEELYEGMPTDLSSAPGPHEGEAFPSSGVGAMGADPAALPPAGGSPVQLGGESGIDPLDAFRGMDVIEGTVRGGNRPAKGARQISAGEILSGNFSGSAAAGDFLGLDTEFTGPSDPLGSVHELFDHQPEYPPNYEDDFDESTATVYDDADAPALGALSPSESEGFAPPADPYDSDGEYDEEEEEYQELEYQESASTPLRLVLVTVVCAVLGAGSVFYAPKILSGEVRVPGMDWIRRILPDNEVTEVATGPSAPVPRTTPGSPVMPPSSASPDPVQPTLPTDELAGEPFTSSEPVVVSGTGSDAVEEPASEPASERVPETQANPFDGLAEATPESLVADTSVSELDTTPVTRPLTPPVPQEPLVTLGDSAAPPSGGVGKLMENLIGREAEGRSGFPDFGTTDIGWISDDRLDMIWRGEEIPPGALEGPAKTLMPRVGVVRVTMRSDQIFEGRLYAAGQNGLWLEFGSGRIKLSGSEIADIQRMAVVADDVRSSEATATMGKRVRATVPGGHIFGRVQKQHGGLVTIRTDSGATVVVESHRVEALGARRAVLIHR